VRDEIHPSRAAAFATRLWEASERLVAMIEPIDDARWRHVPEPGVWSVGKEAEHVAEAAAYHQWILRLTIGEKVFSRRPVIERKLMVSELSPAKAVELLRRRADEGARLLAGLDETQLDLPTKPPRANAQLLAQTIDLVLVGHYEVHRVSIMDKLGAAP
jgi:uncharacterized damage-inducible protein DinB